MSTQGSVGDNSQGTPSSLVSRLSGLKRLQELQRQRLQDSINNSNIGIGDEKKSSLPHGKQGLLVSPLESNKENLAPSDGLCEVTPNHQVIASGEARPLSVAFPSPVSADKEKREDILVKNQSAELDSVPKVKFPFLRKGEGIKRFNYKLGPLKRKKNTSPGVTCDASPRNKLELKEVPQHKSRHTPLAAHHFFAYPKNIALASPMFQRQLKKEQEDLRAFEKLEGLTENSSFCSNSSIVDRLLRNRVSDAIPLQGIDFSPILAEQEGAKASQQAAKKNVQFCERGAHVLEYEDMELPTASDGSTLLNLSDLEALNQLRQDGRYPMPVHCAFEERESERFTSSTPDKQGHGRGLVPSFPGKDREGLHGGASAAAPESHLKDLESQKVLLVSKVQELNREIKIFRNENSQLMKSKNLFQKEKEQWDLERNSQKRLLEEEKVRLERYFERETNKLQSHKCSDSRSDRASALDLIDLKEEILRLKKDISDRDSKHLLAQKKWRQRIAELEQQTSEMKEMVDKYTDLKKENVDLKHTIDRLKMAKKSCNQSTKSLEMRDKGRQNVSIQANVNGENESNSFTPRSVEDAPSCTAKPPFHNPVKDSSVSHDSVTVTHDDGAVETKFANGNKKMVLPSGVEIMEYYNGDRQEKHADRCVYVYFVDQTRHTTFSNGTEEIALPDGRRQVTLPDGTTETVLPDNTKMCVQTDGTEVFHYPDGTVAYRRLTGEEVLEFSNGQIEYHGPHFNKREYPNGSYRIDYNDGIVETKYPNGKIKIKRHK